MRNFSILLAALAVALLSTRTAAARQTPASRSPRLSNAPGPELPDSAVVLRFDQAQSEEVADMPAADTLTHSTSPVRSFAFKLNRRRITEAEAYDAVTLWNVRRVRINDRRMRLSDSTGREKVRLLKFFIERDRKKGARPHLLGNVAGYTWQNGIIVPNTRKWRETPMHIANYTLRHEYDSVRMARGGEVLKKVPDELWRDLSYKAVYELDGERVPGAVFQFIDGLILRTLEVRTDSATLRRYATTHGVVVGDTYPDQIPLVIFNGERSTIALWLKICRSNAFSLTADVPMHYFFMQPVEAVQYYGKRGIYGAICIDLSQ